MLKNAIAGLASAFMETDMNSVFVEIRRKFSGSIEPRVFISMEPESGERVEVCSVIGCDPNDPATFIASHEDVGKALADCFKQIKTSAAKRRTDADAASRMANFF